MGWRVRAWWRVLGGRASSSAEAASGGRMPRSRRVSKRSGAEISRDEWESKRREHVSTSRQGRRGDLRGSCAREPLFPSCVQALTGEVLRSKRKPFSLPPLHWEPNLGADPREPVRYQAVFSASEFLVWMFRASALLLVGIHEGSCMKPTKKEKKAEVKREATEAKKEKGLRHDALVLVHEARYLRRMALGATSLAALGPILKGISILLSQ